MGSRVGIVRYATAILDIFVMLIAYIFANKIKFGYWRTGIRNESNSYMTVFMFFLVAYFIVLLLFFIYDNLITRSVVDELINITKMLGSMTGIVAFYIYITKTNDYYSRVQMAYFLAISYILLFIERQWLKRYITKSFHRSGANEKIMLITTSDCVDAVVKKIKETRNWYFRITNIALLDKDRVGDIVNRIEVVANGQNYMHQIATSEVDSVFLHLPKDYPFAYQQFIEDMQEMGKQVHWNIDAYETASGQKNMQFLGKFAVVTWNNKNYRVRHKALKRALDIIIGLLGTILMAFVYVFVCIGHALEGDNGHVILPYVRVGKNGRRFYQFRFRTLRRKPVNDELGELSVTGRVLKTLGLTNLPMAWNVLWDDMSLVGAEAPSLPKFLNYSRRQRRGLSTKPGVIQFWPAYYWTRKDASDITIEKCEAEYVEHWSLKLDAKIVIRTIGLLFINRSFSKTVHTLDYETWREESNILLNLSKEEKSLVKFKEYVPQKKKTVYHIVKRIFDIVLSILAIIIFSPLLLVLGLFVRWEDGQSVFYKQLRIGYNGKKIYIYKFRSMRARVGDLEKILTPEQLEQYQKEFKIENDPRVTRVGNVLRKTSLDELPQLFNILKGDLSIVGPRPIVEKETEIYGDDLGKFLSARPGLTGYWQAYARNKATYESGERQRMELYYVDHQSLWMDLKIMFKTVSSVLKKEGAM